MAKSTIDELLIVEKTCAVTVFDLKVRVSKDGRNRGLWLQLKDTSEVRSRMYQKWLEGAVETLCKMLGLVGAMDPSNVEDFSKRFHAELTMKHEVGRLLASKVDEGALLEWPAIKEIHRLIGKELTKIGISAKGDARKVAARKNRTTPPRYELIRQEIRKPARFPPPIKKDEQ